MWRAAIAGGPVVLAAFLTAGVAGAQDKAGKPPQAAPAPEQSVPWLLGDWNGERTRLKDRGIDFQFGYVGESAWNATGGTRQKVAYANQFAAGFTLDLDKLLGMPSAQFQATWTQRLGRSLSIDADLGTLQEVQEIFGRGQTTRLTQFWFQQQYFGGLADWKVGRMSIGEDFAAFACDFENLTFCGAAPGNIVGDYIWTPPISQWATRLKFNLNNFGYFQFGVYDDNPKYLGLQQAVLPVWFSGSNGALIPVELAWLPTLGSGALQGSYKIGAWYDTSTADDPVDDETGNPFVVTGLPPARHSGRYGAYINFQQEVTHNLQLFLNAVIADNRTATIDRQIYAGFVYTGPFDSRPKDDIGFAFGSTILNDRVSEEEGIEGAEYAAELYYTFRPNAAVQIRPNLQYIYHPGGDSQNGNVLAVGLKTSADF